MDVVSVAKQATNKAQEVVVLQTGYKVRLHPVSPSVINDAQLSVPDPEVPTWYNQQKDRDEPNPNDPAYIRALEDAQAKRVLAATDVIIFLGVEVLEYNGEPVEIHKDDAWIKRLRFLNKRKLIKVDFDSFDLNDPMDVEFLFKKYVVVSTRDLNVITRMAGLTEAEITAAEQRFQDN